MTAKHLFIGGIADGQWIEVAHYQPVRCVPKPIPFSPVQSGEVVPEVRMHCDVYHRRRYRDGDGNDTDIFVLEGQRPMRALVENYRPGPVVSGTVHTWSVELNKEQMLPLLRAGRQGQTVQVVFPVDPERRSA